MVIPVYTIRDLERRAAVPRTTIHYYLRQGLLPRPQKTAASRSLYTEEHVMLLKRIAELKREGRSLDQIGTALQASVDRVNEATVDLAAQERERMHDRILALAADEFLTIGYGNTHVTTIMRELGITATLFYTHFPSKRRLLAECVLAMVDASNEFVAGKMPETRDQAERLLWLLFGRSRVLELGATALAVMRLEETEDDELLNASLEEARAKAIAHISAGLIRGERGEGGPKAVAPELIALNLLGAYEHSAFRSRYDKQYSRKDLLRAHLWLFLAAQAGQGGEIDIDSRLAPYEELISTLSAEMPPLPPRLELYTKAIVPPSG